MPYVLHSDRSSEFVSELTSLSDENNIYILPNELQLRKKMVMRRALSSSSIFEDNKENIPPNGLQLKMEMVMRGALSSSSFFDDNKENIPPQGLQFSSSITSEDDKENIPPQRLKPKRKEMISRISIDGKKNIPFQVLYLRKQKMLHAELPPLVQPEDLERDISKTSCIKRFFGWILRGSSVDQITDVFFFGCRLIKKIFWVNLPRACRLMLPRFGVRGHFTGPSLDDATCEVVDGLTYAAVHLNTWRQRRYAGPQCDELGIQSAVVPSPRRSLSSAALQFAADRQSEADISDELYEMNQH